MRYFVGLICCAGCLSGSLSGIRTAHAQKPAAKIAPKHRPYTEAERHKIFLEITTAEKRGSDEALRKHPIKELTDKEFETFGQASGLLIAKYGLQVIQRYKLTEEEVAALSAEATKKKWPFPVSDFLLHKWLH